MARVIFELAGFFFVPFLAYAAFVIWVGKHPREAKKIFEKKAFLIQTIIGLALMAGVLLFLGFTDAPNRGAYQPAVFKDGKLVPGSIQ
jgi:heme/copper-type cytochrome/quinol oxidase subunit 1